MPGVAAKKLRVKESDWPGCRLVEPEGAPDRENVEPVTAMDETVTASAEVTGFETLKVRTPAKS